jgi:ubiquitin carboxyl-terminal hydrolase 5/13
VQKIKLFHTDIDEAPMVAPEVSAESLALLIGMGFEENLVRLALMETQGSIERSVEWLFNRVSSTTVESPFKTHQEHELEPHHEINYSLHAFISHKGPSVHCGHYVCHIHQDNADPDHQWIIFNDCKIAFVPNPPIGEAYMYFFRRDPQ